MCHTFVLGVRSAVYSRRVRDNRREGLPPHQHVTKRMKKRNPWIWSLKILINAKLELLLDGCKQDNALNSDYAIHQFIFHLADHGSIDIEKASDSVNVQLHNTLRVYMFQCYIRVAQPRRVFGFLSNNWGNHCVRYWRVVDTPSKKS